MNMQDLATSLAIGAGAVILAGLIMKWGREQGIGALEYASDGFDT